MSGVNLRLKPRYRGLVIALIVSNLVSLGFLVAKMISVKTLAYNFLAWNLVLAWFPLIFAVYLMIHLRTRRWLSITSILLTLAWLVFLPNSFYLASDFIHLRVSSNVNVLFDAIMLLSFTFNGFVAGMLSIYVVHRELYRRFYARQAHTLIGLAIMAASFAIYLGRYLRWNTWDVLLNPLGLLFDVSDRLINPTAHPQLLSTTLGFSILLGSMYAVLWQFARALQDD